MSPSFQTILAALQRHGVEFAVVGGVAAVLHGAPVTTFDLDTLVRVDEKNADRLLAAFDEINARYRGHAPPLKPVREDILAGKHLLLMTDAGPLDVLGFIGRDDRYEDLCTRFETVRLEGVDFSILGLDELIRQKRAMGREKDLIALRLLEAVKREREGE
ncbi:hypothetical protein [Pseudomarimonas salicorniae]|uniref:Nucleotidyltransferase n=1 Tax=Pseudomarimonas salicorniae TaxID=2933270 RepID=A0ABT0GEF5_9GAMM|nr:hypothetical protein [Lysobacter sp. CAU 1642]MCK7592927.1 hypothetical protein [Lysobacter sp. CAU 1642]